MDLDSTRGTLALDLPKGSRPPPAAVGDSLDRVRTPALVIEREALLHNLRTLPALVAGEGVRIRAHFKAHKCGAIAKLQLDEGRADGFCFQKVSEVEGLLRHFEEADDKTDGAYLDLMVTNEVVEPSKLKRLCQLTHHRLVKRMGVAVDDINVLEVLIEEANAEKAKELNVLIEIDVGQQRCGIDVSSPEGQDAFLKLAKRLMEVHKDSGRRVRFAGLQAYHGCTLPVHHAVLHSNRRWCADSFLRIANQHVRQAAERERTVQHMTLLVNKAVDLLTVYHLLVYRPIPNHRVRTTVAILQGSS